MIACKLALAATGAAALGSVAGMMFDTEMKAPPAPPYHAVDAPPLQASYRFVDAGPYDLDPTIARGWRYADRSRGDAVIAPDLRSAEYQPAPLPEPAAYQHHDPAPLRDLPATPIALAPPDDAAQAADAAATAADAQGAADFDAAQDARTSF